MLHNSCLKLRNKALSAGKKECHRNADNSSIIIICHCRDRRSEWWQQKETNAKQMPKHRQKKKKKKNQLCIFIPSLPSRILQQLKSLIQNASLIQSAWKNSIFPKYIFWETKKENRKSKYTWCRRRTSLHTSAHSTSDKEVFLFTHTLSQTKNQCL